MGLYGSNDYQNERSLEMDYYGKNKVISRSRLGTTIDELNTMLDKAVYLLERATHYHYEPTPIDKEINEFLWRVNFEREEHKL